ncbi:MAG: hypothetical protein K2H12_02030, partial [Acetatifactor sp.]|nr:hypothetical protein [Acetatifactor sp.]
MKRIYGVLVFIVSVFLFLGIYQQVKADTGQGRVLFISSYSYGWDTVQLQIEGLKEGMDPDIAVDYEFMDTKRLDVEVAEQLLYERLAYTLSVVPPYDVIIVGDDAALKFAMDYREELFSGIPIVFEGINNVLYAMELAEQDPLVTGVLEELSLEKNIDLILQLRPETKRIVAILDDSLTGQAERQNFYAIQESYPNLTFAEINVSDCTTVDLRTRLWQQSNDAVLLFLLMSEDKSGKLYTNLEAVQAVVKYTKVPVMRMVDSRIEEGLLGGYVASMRKSGQIAAQMASSIIRGMNPSKIAVAESPNLYYINEEVMLKYDLDISKLPKDVEIINHQTTFFEKYSSIVLPMVIFAIAMVIILVIVGYDNLHRRKLLSELEGTRTILE